MLIGGDFKVVGPAEPIVTTPEQDAHAERKRLAAKEHRANRKATGELPEPLAEQITEQSPEVAAEAVELPWQRGSTPLAEATVSEDEGRLPDESKWPVLNGQHVSPKYYARKMQEAKEAEASERGDVGHVSPKLAYTGNLATDEEFSAAQLAFEGADRQLKALAVEQAGLTDRFHDAIAGQDLEAIRALKARQRELPDEVFAARFGATQARLRFAQFKAARARIAKKEARAAASQANADFQEWQVKVNEAVNESLTAEYASDDAVREVGAALRELDALKAEALAQAIGPQAHRAPTGMVEYGQDSSGLGPMPHGGQ